MSSITKCIHGHTLEEIKFYGCETNPLYQSKNIEWEDEFEGQFFSDETSLTYALNYWVDEMKDHAERKEYIESVKNEIKSFISKTIQAAIERTRKEVAESEVVREFLEATPKWLENMESQKKHGGTEDCVFCGMKPSKIRTLYNFISTNSQEK